MKKTNEQFIKDANLKHNNLYDYSLTEYRGCKNKVKIICPNNHIFEQSPNDHLNGHGCKECSGWGSLKFNKDEFILRSIKLNKDRYDYSKSVYIDHDSPIIITCKIHGDFVTTPKGHLISNNHCPKCSNELLKKYARSKAFSNEQFINAANKVHGYLYDYSKVCYYNMVDKVIIICKKHGEFKQSPKCHINQKHGCPKCRLSKGELNIKKYLEENNINYVYQHKFEDCKNNRCLPFDFYLPNYNTCIEFDGKQHYEPIKHFKGVEGFQKVQQSDQIKTLFCQENNIPLIRISYKEKNIFTFLNKYLK